MSAFRLRRKELDQLLTRDAPAEHRRTRGICPVCMENLLCDIQTDRANFFHGRLLSDGRFNTTILAHRCRRGRPHGVIAGSESAPEPIGHGEGWLFPDMMKVRAHDW